MSKLSLRVCPFSYFLTKLMREVFSGFITPYIYLLEYACQHMLPLTYSSKHSSMTIMHSNCSSFIQLLVFAYLGDTAHRSFVCYLLGLRRQTNPLYTSTTLLDNHHCCAWLFISTLFLCRFCLFWTYVSISSCALICQFTTIIQALFSHTKYYLHSFIFILFHILTALFITILSRPVGLDFHAEAGFDFSDFFPLPNPSGIFRDVTIWFYPIQCMFI